MSDGRYKFLVFSMRVTDATNDTFDSLTTGGTVVVAFYSSACSGYKDARPPEQRSAVAPHLTWKPKRRRHPDAIRNALKSATWEHDRKIRVVFAASEQCRVSARLGTFPTFWILKDGERVAAMHGMYQGGHRDSYRLARKRFAEWLAEHLPPAE